MGVIQCERWLHGVICNNGVYFRRLCSVSVESMKREVMKRDAGYREVPRLCL